MTLMDNRSAYEAMPDWKLEALSVKYRIPPPKRVDERGEHSYFDRDLVIEALVNRDAGVPPVRSARAASPHGDSSRLLETCDAGKGTDPQTTSPEKQATRGEQLSPLHTESKRKPRKGDVGLLQEPDGRLKESVSFEHASLYLGVSLRQVQRLVSAKKGLRAIGGGHNKQITVSSLLEYLPAKKAT
jgi:hypothetical protein